MEMKNLENRSQLAAFFSEFYQTGLGVEVGVQFGRFALEIKKTWNGRMVLVDAWRHFPDDSINDASNVSNGEHINRMIHCSRQFSSNPLVMILKGISTVAASIIQNESCDFVYLDANHSRESVEADIKAWLPKLRRGGIIAGHDWGAREDMGWGVRSAVLSFFPENRVGVTKESYPSWFTIVDS